MIILFSFRRKIWQRNETQNERREKEIEKRAETKSIFRTKSVSVNLIQEKAEKKAKKRQIQNQEVADFEVNLKSSHTILEDEPEVVGLNYTEFARQYSKAVSDLGVPETMTNYQINEGFEKNILWSLKNKV